MTMNDVLFLERDLFSYFIYLIVISVAVIWIWHLYLQLPWPGECRLEWSWLPVLGHALDLGTQPVALLQKLAAKGEDLVGILVGGQRIFFIMDLLSAPVGLRSGEDYSTDVFHDLVAEQFFGMSHFAVKNHAYDADLVRKWGITYLLGDNAIDKLTRRVQEEMRSGLRDLPEGSQKLFASLSRVIFKAAVRAILHHDALTDAELSDVMASFETFDSNMPLLLAGLPAGLLPGFRQARDRLCEICARSREQASDYMSKRWEHFLELEAVGKMQKGDSVRGQLSIVWAVVGNTMPSAFWLVYYLLSHPHALQKVKEEIGHVLTGYKMEMDEISYEQCRDLVYLDACITETLRLASGSLIMRYVNRPCSITLASGKTYKLRKGDRLGICPPVVHRDSDLFPEPEAFRPERWILSDGHRHTVEEKINAAQGKISLTKGGKEVPSHLSFLAFGAGLAHCPGRRLARNQLKVLVVCLLSSVEMTLLRPDEPAPEVLGARAGLGIFPPKEDVDVRVCWKKAPVCRPTISS